MASASFKIRTRLVFVTFFMSGCSDGNVAREQRSTSTSGSRSDTAVGARVPQSFTIRDSLLLRESGDRVVIAPFVSIYDDTTIFVADPKSRVVGRYSRDGHLLWARSTRGRGPGELELPIALAPSNDGVWVLDIFNGLMLLNGDESGEVRRLRNGSNALQGLQMLDDSTLLVAGRGREIDGASPWLQAVDARSGQTRWSTLTISPSATLRPWYSSFGYAAISRNATSIVATFSLADTIYEFGLDGTLRERYVDSFVDTAALGKLQNRKPQPAEISQLVRLVGAFRIDDSTMAIQMQRGSARSPDYSIAMYNTRERKLRSVHHHTPMIGAVHNGLLYLLYSDSDRPNFILVVEP